MPLTTPLKKRPTLFSQKIFVSKNKTKQTKKRISDYSKIGYSFLTPPRRLQRSEKGFFIYKSKNKVGRNYDCDISRKKIKKWRIFFCVCACCVLTKFFFDPRSGARTSTLLVEK